MTQVEECAVWWAETRHGRQLAELLTPAEQHRAASIHGVGRQAFVAARALIRVVLADLQNEPPHSFAIVNQCRVCGSDQHGQPTLPGLDLFVSISHSGGQVGVALAPIAIGIDIEAITPQVHRETRRLVEYALTPAERRTWAALPPDRQAAAALAWWTRKESVLKGVGWGLAIAPALLHVTGPDDRPAVTEWAPAAMEMLGFELPVVHLYDLQPGPDHIGFVASVGGPVSITQHRADALLARVPSGTQ